MLENAGLWIKPWQWTSADPTGHGRRGVFAQRAIADSSRGDALGFVSWQRGWFWRLRRQALEVYENPDASLLSTMWRPGCFGRVWEVCDAENRRRGLIDRTWVFDAAGDGLALVDLPAGSDSGRFLGPTGMDLGTFHLRGSEGARLHFARDLDPFSRMVLLGAVLSFG